MQHIDLCSGIGGFALGFEWAGLSKPVMFCDIEPWSRQILAKHWPDVPIKNDVKELANDPDGLIPDTDPRRTILTAGYPCQPFSFAGKRGGSEDDRHIWPYIFSIIQARRPKYCVFENVYGHVSMGLDEVLSDLEREAYAARPFIVPACAIDAHHRRDRLWIIARNVAYSNRDKHNRKVTGKLGETRSDEKQVGQKHRPPRELGRASKPRVSGDRYETAETLADPSGQRLQGDKRLSENEGKNKEWRTSAYGAASQCGDDVADTDSTRQQQSHKEVAGQSSEQSDSGSLQPSKDVADTNGKHRRRVKGQKQSEGNALGKPAGNGGEHVADTSSIRLQRRSEKQVHGQRNLSQQSVRSRQGKPTQRPSQSRLGGMVDGLPKWMDEPPDIPRTTGSTKGRAARLKGLGNAIVPGIAQRIGETIKQCEAEL